MVLAWENTWDCLVASGWSLGYLSYRDRNGARWVVDAARYGADDVRRHVAEAGTLEEAVRMVAAKVAAERHKGDRDHQPLADCQKPGHVDCECAHEGSCVTGPEDRLELVNGEWA